LWFHSVSFCHTLSSPAEDSNAPEKLQLVLNELWYDSILHSSFNQKALITFHASLPVSQLSEL